jgi:hypothetical protein
MSLYSTSLTENSGIGCRAETTNYVIQANHNILSIDMLGTWNEGNTLDYVAEYKRLVNRYFTQEWACIVNLKGMEMLLSESFQIETLRALNAWSYIKGMKAISVVFSSNNRSHLLYQFEEIFKVKHPYATAVCLSEFEAVQWIESQGFKIKAAPRSPQAASFAV